MSKAGEIAYYLITDPDQELQGFYKLVKTNNISNIIASANTCRAKRDAKQVKTWACQDTKRADVFIKEALKKKWINGTEWIQCDAKDLEKMISTISQLIDIVNTN